MAAYLVSKGYLALESSPVIIISVFILLLSIAGMIGARKKARGASCVIVSYFYIVFFVILALVFLALNSLVLQDSLQVRLCVRL